MVSNPKSVNTLTGTLQGVIGIYDAEVPLGGVSSAPGAIIMAPAAVEQLGIESDGKTAA